MAQHTIVKTCKCNKQVEISVNDTQLFQLSHSNMKIQDILPFKEYTPEQREMFVTGICQECWDELFKDEEDDEPCVQSLSEEEIDDMNQRDYQNPFSTDDLDGAYEI